MISRESEEEQILMEVAEHYLFLEERIRKAFRGGRKIRVLIYEHVSNITKESLIRALNYHPAFDLSVHSHDASPIAKEYYQSLCVNVTLGGDVFESCLEKEVDILFIDTPHYNFWFHPPSHDFYSEIPEAIFRQLLICYIPYSYMCMRNVETYSDYVHRYVWKFFVEGDYQEGKAKSVLNRVDNVLRTGHPYLDAYYTNHEIEPPSGKVVLLWAPHHNETFYNDISLKDQDTILRKFLDSNPNVELVFRPHPNLFGVLASEKHLESSDYKILVTFEYAKEMKQYWENHERVVCEYSGHISKYFAYSHLIITNCVGFQMEMLHAGRPIINLINQGALTSQMANFQDQCYLPSNSSDFEELLQEFLASGLSLVPDRRKVAEVLPLPGMAGVNIASHIYDIFKDSE